MCGSKSPEKIEKAPLALDVADAPPEPPVAVKKSPKKSNKRNDLKIDLASKNVASGLNLQK